MKGKYPKAIKTNHPVKIDTGVHQPSVSSYRRFNEKEQVIVDDYVDKLVAADVVEPCSGPWASPILLVPKKDGSLRAVADLRKVNECAVFDSYSMPDVQETLDQLAKAKWSTTLDLSSAFWPLPSAEESGCCVGR